jgi:hypothetical protein
MAPHHIFFPHAAVSQHHLPLPYCWIKLLEGVRGQTASRQREKNDMSSCVGFCTPSIMLMVLEHLGEEPPQ